MTKRTPIQIEKQVIADYLSKICIKEICTKYKISSSSLYNILKRNNVKILPKVLSSKDDIEKISQDYSEGFSVSAIAKIYNVSSALITQRLRENNVLIRGCSKAQIVKNANKKLKQINVVTSLYKQGFSFQQISDKTKYSIRTVKDTLHSQGLWEPRIKAPSKKLTDNKIKRIIHEYLQGKSTSQLARELNIHSSTVYRILKKNGIGIRIKSLNGDSFNDLLNNKNRFANEQATYFYVYSLNQYPDYLKIGITSDLYMRTRKGYGKRLKVLSFQRRHEAYALEQAMLNATKTNHYYPSDYINWPGVTEIRRMSQENLFDILEEMLNTLTDKGLYQFMLKHCLLYAHQRKKIEKLISDQQAA